MVPDLRTPYLYFLRIHTRLKARVYTEKIRVCRTSKTIRYIYIVNIWEYSLPPGLCCNLHVVSPDYVFYSTYQSVSKSLGQQIAWIKPTLGNEDPTAKLPGKNVSFKLT